MPPNARGPANSATRLLPRARALLGRGEPEPQVEDVSSADDNVFVFPASFAQQRLWFLDRLDPGGTAYNLPLLLRVAGDLDVSALERALSALVERHEVLRTTFFEEGGVAQQAVGRAEPVPLPVVDVSGAADPEAEALRLAAEEVGKPFDLAVGPLIRTGLVKIGDRDHLLTLTLHHIAADGWSMGVLGRDLDELYTAARAGRAPALPVLQVQYGDFSLWQHEWLQGARLAKQLAYWRSRLEGAPAVLELPTDLPRPPVQSFRGAHRRRMLPVALAERLRELGQQEDASLFMTLLAGFTALLGRYSGQQDLTVGTPIANRNRVEIENLIGFFANTLVLRADLRDDPTFRELLRRSKDVTLDAFAHQDLPFERLVAELNPARQRSYAPLFQVLFAVQHAGGGLQLPGLEVTRVELERGSAKFDLALFMTDTPDGLRASVEYCTDLFEDATIERMLGHLETLLEAVAANPERRLSEIPLLTEGERELLVRWNATGRDLPGRDRCVHELVEAQVARTPDAPAASFGGQTLSYAELNGRANALAERLSALGVGPDVPVAICAERSPELLVAVVGTLKAGGAYSPLDPGYPPERLRLMIEDLAPPVLLVQRALVERLPRHDAQVVVLDDGQEPAVASTDPAPRSAGLDNLAYVLFTSGSTGRPKGVAMPHGPLSNLVAWQLESWTPPASAKTLQFAALSFDVAFQEMFTTWAAGGTLVLVDDETRRDATALLELLDREGVERLFLPYIALQHLAEASQLTGVVPHALREVITAGEALLVTPAVRAFFGRLEGCVLHNEYGPTESHVVTQLALAGPADDWPSRPSIGRPIANARIHLLDAHGAQVPIGVPGELTIAGPVLARGYVGRPDLTAERFVPDPFAAEPDAHMYRTGDLARYLPDGRIDYLGRSDTQVKVRGFRVELGEVEAVLLEHPQVRDAVAIVREDQPDVRQLVAYVTGIDGQVDELRPFLRERVPEFMVPSAIVSLEALPIGPNGKVDRRSLPAPTRRPADRDVVLPRDETERALEKIWQDALGITAPIGIDEDFFELGGHSLLAVSLFATIERKVGVRLPLAILFQGATIADLAAAVRRERGSGERWSCLVPLQGTESTKPPLFLMHVLNGQLLKYRDLLRHVDPDQPVYGLQAVGLDGRALPHATIEEMAAEYVQEIRKFQPHGPYMLGGLCFAGVIAYEMAGQLAKLGEETSLLAMIDSSPLNRATLRGTRPRLELEREKFRRFLHADLRGKWAWIARRARGVKDKLHLKTGLWVYERRLREGRPLPRRPWNFVYVADVQAIGRYMTRPTGTHVTLFRAQEDPDDRRQTPWMKLAGGGVDLRPIVAPGIKHTNIFREPYVRLVAEELMDAIKGATSHDGEGR